MGPFTQYLLSMAIVFVIWGAVWYNLDRAYGVKVRRFWYNMTHEKPLPAGDVGGFIYGRDTQTKFTWATVLSTVQSALVVLYSESIDLLWEIPAWLIEIPLMLVGMHLGHPLGRLWAGKSKVFEKLDDWERVGDDRPSPAAPPAPQPSSAPAGESEPPQAPKPEDPEPDPDPQTLMDRFTKRRGG